jgi:hypothetical protein
MPNEKDGTIYVKASPTINKKIDTEFRHLISLARAHVQCVDTFVHIYNRIATRVKVRNAARNGAEFVGDGPEETDEST